MRLALALLLLTLLTSPARADCPGMECKDSMLPPSESDPFAPQTFRCLMGGKVVAATYEGCKQMLTDYAARTGDKLGTDDEPVQCSIGYGRIWAALATSTECDKLIAQAQVCMKQIDDMARSRFVLPPSENEIERYFHRDFFICLGGTYGNREFGN